MHRINPLSSAVHPAQSGFAKFPRSAAKCLIAALFGVAAPICLPAAAQDAAGRGSQLIEVADSDEFRRALGQARPGTVIRLKPGRYRGGIHASGPVGERRRPIVIEAADPDNPPVIEGGGTGLQLSQPAHLEIRGLVITGATANGINIDDGGSFETPARHIVLKNLTVRDIGPEGNRDGIKLSGVTDFKVDNCTIERWGNGGSAIDMVGCHRGEILRSTFRHEKDNTGDNAVQTKGGSSEIAIRGCRFEHAGSRAVNIGGSTGMAFFRPEPQGYEAKDITVEDNVFIGSQAAAAFVGVDGAVMRFNTIYRPQRWVFRILQETRRPDFVPSRNGRFSDNIIAFRSDEVVDAVNVGPDTAPETFEIARNVWYCIDNPARSRMRLPVAEEDGRYGIDPQFVDAAAGDLTLRPGSPAADAGVRSGASD